MPDPMPPAPRSKTRPQLKYLFLSGLAVAVLSTGLLVFYAVYMTTTLAAPIVAPWFGRVPQLSGTVVDAVTGQPLSEMNVCLIAMSRGIGGTDFDRAEVTQTDASGRFSFPPSTQKGFGFAGYEMEIADPAAEIGLSCGKNRDLLANSTLLQRVPLPSGEYRKPFYFPVIIMGGNANDPQDLTVYGPLLQKFTDPANIRVALIPLFPDDGQCDTIKNATNAKYCRWLNDTGEATDMRKLERPSKSR